MQLIGEVIGQDEEGNDLVTFAFAPQKSRRKLGELR